MEVSQKSALKCVVSVYGGAYLLSRYLSLEPLFERIYESKKSDSIETESLLIYGADGRSRTGTAFATTPSR